MGVRSKFTFIPPSHVSRDLSLAMETEALISAYCASCEPNDSPPSMASAHVPLPSVPVLPKPSSPPPPSFVKPDYFAFDHRCEVGAGIVNSSVKVYLRKMSPHGKMIPSQSMALTVREWNTIKGFFPRIDNFFTNIVGTTDTYYFDGMDRFLKVVKDGPFSKVSLRRPSGKRHKGITYALSEWDNLKKYAFEVDRQIVRVQSANEPELNHCALRDIGKVIIVWKFEQLSSLPTLFCPSHDDPHHICTIPSEFTFTTLNAAFPRFQSELNQRGAAILISALASYMGISITLDAASGLIAQLLNEDRQGLISAMFSETYPAIDASVRTAFTELFA